MYLGKKNTFQHASKNKYNVRDNFRHTSKKKYNNCLVYIIAQD